MTTVGIIGAGRIGSALATVLAQRGYQVVLSNSRGPETLAELVAELGPNVTAATSEQAAAAGDWAIVTVPLKAIDRLPVAALDGKIVLDTCNYYWERDGHIAALDEKRTTTSQLVQDRLPGSRVAKAFNHIVAEQIPTDGRPAGSPDRRALATAGDFEDAVALATSLYDELGYDAVNVGPLAESWRIERDQPAYLAGAQTAEELRANLALATR